MLQYHVKSADVCGRLADVPSPAVFPAFTRVLPFGVKQRNLLFLGLVLATVAWFLRPLGELFFLTQQQEHYSHMLLIPCVSLSLICPYRKALLTSREWSPWLGLLLLVGGASLYGVADEMTQGLDSLSMIMLSLVVVCWGIFVMCFGIQSCRNISFGLLFLLFMVPIPSMLMETLIRFLQRSSTEATGVLFTILGVPVSRQGFVFSLSHFTITISEECSGIRSALSLFITSLVAGYLCLRSGWSKTGLASVVIPLAIVKNAFRIVGLALLANYVDPTYITNSTLHRSGGIPLFLVSLVVLFSLVWLLRRLEKRFGYDSAP